MLRVTYPLVYPRQDIGPTVYHLRPRDYWNTYNTIIQLLLYYSLLTPLLTLLTREPLEFFWGEEGGKRQRYRRKLRVDGQADSDGGGRISDII
jgi:hypothetical protein